MPWREPPEWAIESTNIVLAYLAGPGDLYDAAISISDSIPAIEADPGLNSSQLEGERYAAML